MAKPVSDKPFDFTATLVAFQKSTVVNMQQARALAEFALVQFHQHNNLDPAIKFYAAMAKNFHRRNAFIAWMGEYSPFMVKGGKFVRDTRDNAKPFNVEAALAISFWDFKPEAEIVNFRPGDVIEALERTAKSFRNNRHNPADQTAVDFLARAEKMLATLRATAPGLSSNVEGATAVN